MIEKIRILYQKSAKNYQTDNLVKITLCMEFFVFYNWIKQFFITNDHLMKIRQLSEKLHLHFCRGRCRNFLFLPFSAPQAKIFLILEDPYAKNRSFLGQAKKFWGFWKIKDTDSFFFCAAGENFENFGRPRSQISFIFSAAGENFEDFRRS